MPKLRPQLRPKFRLDQTFNFMKQIWKFFFFKFNFTFIYCSYLKN